jgi:phosphocarrier protein HPr
VGFVGRVGKNGQIAMLSRSVTVGNKLGLHARAAARFVHLASRFQSHVRVSRGSQTMDGKSIMGILLLAAATGTMLRVSADGEDEQEALDALCGFIETGFGEDTCSA